jgi:hypothetical protein
MSEGIVLDRRLTAPIGDIFSSNFPANSPCQGAVASKIRLTRASPTTCLSKILGIVVMLHPVK